jgi:hypothetical protein
MTARIFMSAQKDHADINERLLTISITGHRWNKLTTGDVPRIELELIRVFGMIDHAVQSLSCNHPKRASARKGLIWLLSGLAEGADQLAFRVAPTEWRRAAVLPFSKYRYMLDFAPERATGGVDRRSELTAGLAQADVVIELAGLADATLAYEAAGDQMLAGSDLLIAVWDGKKGAGRGGTESVVEKALNAMPVVWIPSNGSRASTLLVTVDDLRDPDRASGVTADTVTPHIHQIVGSLPKPVPSAH